MRKVAVITNVVVARATGRLRHFERALHAYGIDTRLFHAMSPAATAAVLVAAREAASDAVIAAGGDGTFNYLLQAAVNSHSDVPLGVVPFGSGNILAGELRVGSSAEEMAAAIAGACACQVSIGKLTAQLAGSTIVRHFTVAAGVGADARVICAVNPALKARLGIASYYLESMRQLFFSAEPLPRFRVAFTDTHSGVVRDEEVTQLIAERVSYFGRCLLGHSEHSLYSRELRLVLFKTQRRSAFFAYGALLLAARLAERSAHIRGIEVAHARQVNVLPLDNSPVPVLAEVDGEFVGQLPAQIAIAADPVQILVPSANGELEIPGDSLTQDAKSLSNRKCSNF